ncbi:hypothetical protein V6N13_094115 [Hibiscus sabdariffa]|uniref:Transmembrane protein n=2 Tax=Hibiscus sabdariffa TaxID=183260 RepID=A0ABR2BKF2_9ROSI
MAMKLKSSLPFVPLLVFLSFTLLVCTLEARTFAPNHLRHAHNPVKEEKDFSSMKFLKLSIFWESRILLGQVTADKGTDIQSSMACWECFKV